VRTKSQLGWFNLPHLPILPPELTAKQRVLIIPRKSTRGSGIYDGKDFERRKVLRREWYGTPRERSTNRPGSVYEDGEELGDDEGSN